MLFSWMLLGERPRRGALGALALTLIGVTIIVGVRELTLHAWRGEALGVLSAVLSGVAVTSIRASRRASAAGPPPETAWSVFFSFTLLGSVVSVPWAVAPFGRWVPPTGGEWLLLLGVAAVSVGAQIIMTESIGHLTGVQSGIISQLTVPMTIVLGLLVLDERLTDEAEKFVEQNRDRPFFLYMAHFLPHTSMGDRLQARADKIAKYQKKAGSAEANNQVIYAAIPKKLFKSPPPYWATP